MFFVDQAIHLVSILIAANILHSFEFGHYLNFYHQFVSGTVTLSNSLTAIKKELLVLIYLCLATSVSNIVIKTLVGGLKKDLGSDSKPGRYIGGVERILTIAIILAGAWQALAVLYGSKTAIRFEKAKEDPEFAEYYILGTSLSALFGVLIAVAAKITNKYPTNPASYVNNLEDNNITVLRYTENKARALYGLDIELPYLAGAAFLMIMILTAGRKISEYGLAVLAARIK